MIEQFNFDIQLILCILNGKFPQQSTGSYIAISVRTVWKSARNNGRFSFFMGKDGVTQQSCAMQLFKDKTSMTRLIDNAWNVASCSTYFPTKRSYTNLIHLTKDGKKELEEKAHHCQGQTLRKLCMASLSKN